MNGLTAADFADTGQWRLILKIFPSGMSAHLENTIHLDLEPQLLFSTQWEADGTNLLRNIENAVYDHPRVLDDFSARIIIYERKVLFMPTELIEEADGAEESYYVSIYESEPSDVMTETDRDITVAYAPAPGLKGFLNRTFPGARIGCNLMDVLRKNRDNGEGVRMVVSVRDEEADFLLLSGNALLSASTHGWTGVTDIVYHAFNIMDVYGVSHSETALILAGKPLPEEIMNFLGKFCANIEIKS